MNSSQRCIERNKRAIRYLVRQGLRLSTWELETMSRGMDIGSGDDLTTGASILGDVLAENRLYTEAIQAYETSLALSQQLY